MTEVATDEQKMIAETCSKFLAEQAPVSRVREYRNDDSGVRWSRELWTGFAELGLLGIGIPDQYGGAGLGLAELAILHEHAGRSLAPEPLLSTLTIATNLISRLGTDDQKQMLTDIAAGKLVIGIAFQEDDSRYEPLKLEAMAVEINGRWHLNGRKIQALDAVGADLLMVSASNRLGPTLFLVDPSAEGVRITPQNRIDHFNTAIVDFDDVIVESGCLLGWAGESKSEIQDAWDLATVALSAQMLGAAQHTFDLALAYLKERQQFGVPIGSFQALQHRAARMFMQLELARSAVYGAVQAIDTNSSQAEAMVSLAKAKMSDTFILIANEAVQFHGGVGVTDEYDVGLFLKRARCSAASFGDAAWHRNRWAELAGY